MGALKSNPNHLGTGPGGGQFTTAGLDGTSNGLPTGSGKPARSSLTPPSRASATGTQVAQIRIGPLAETMTDILGETSEESAPVAPPTTTTSTPTVADTAAAIGRAGEVGSAEESIDPEAASVEDVKPEIQNYDWKLGDFKSAQRWQNQMTKRGWTDDQIDEAIREGEQFPAPNEVNEGNPAIRYVNPTTGRYVVRDEVTKEILQVGGDGFNPPLMPLSTR